MRQLAPSRTSSRLRQGLDEGNHGGVNECDEGGGAAGPETEKNQTTDACHTLPAGVPPERRPSAALVTENSVETAGIGKVDRSHMSSKTSSKNRRRMRFRSPGRVRETP